MNNGHNLEKARDALFAIDPDCSREEWVRVGMAAHAAGVTFEDFDSWSAGSGKYKGQDARGTWRSFRADGGIGPGTLFRIAREAGWREGDGRSLRTRNASRTRHEPLESEHVGVNAAAIWDRLESATNSHPYIIEKQVEGVPLDGLRVVPRGDPLEVAGLSMVGALVVPVLPLDGGGPVSLQFIAGGAQGEAWKAAGRPKKLNLPGAPMSGVSVVGELATAGTAYLCEGLGQAWAVWKSTGAAAVVCFGWGRVRAVAVELRQRDSQAKLVLVPDVGKERSAFEIAAEVGATVASMPSGWPENSDVADLAQQMGAGALARLLEDAKPPEPPALPFAVVPLVDLDAQEPPAPEFVWENLIPAETVTLLAAHGGTGKSFVGLMLCVAVALGLPMFGLRTRAGKAAFFSGEDGAALPSYRLRFVCWRMGVDFSALDGRLHIIDATEQDPRLYIETGGRRDGDLTPTFEGLREYVQREGISFLVLDNASDTFDAPETDRARVRAFMRALTLLARQAKAGVLLLAHVDKGTSRGDRGPNSEGYSGSTAWHNSARSRLFMQQRKEGGFLLEHQKGNLSAGLAPKILLDWKKNDIPRLAAADPETQQVSTVEQQPSDAGKALLRLIDEFTTRGEWISPSINSRTHAEKLLGKERTYPKMKRAEVFDVLRNEQRAGRLMITSYKGPDRKPRERWEVTPEGKAYAEIAVTAVSAATSELTAPSAADAEPAASAASALQGVWGKERAHEPAAEAC